MLLHRASPSDAAGDTDAPPWHTRDIVFLAVVGPLLLLALIEWVLWLLSFSFCLLKVFQKASGRGSYGIRILCVLNLVVFLISRLIFLGVMAVTLPLPDEIVAKIPDYLTGWLREFAFWSFAGLLTVPWVLCVWQLVTQSVGRESRIQELLEEETAPKAVIVMPCYHEKPEILLRTVDSIVTCDYPPSCLHIFLSFDGDQEDELYLTTIQKLGVPLIIGTYPKSIDITYRHCRITVSRFPHGGKRSCQKKTFRLIDKVYYHYLRRNDDLFMLFIDSDCILDKACIRNFMYEMELKPGSKGNMLAMTGVITSTTEKNTFLTILQDIEYVHGQCFERSVESLCGAVTCLPGALTMLRFSAFRKMAKYYFADKAEQCDDMFDYGKCHLGEDRWLTHLFMIGAKKRYQIQLNTGAFCKTEAVQSFTSLLKQRRRWFLGFITNEACMLTDIRLWIRYPLVLLMRLAQNCIRSTSLLFYIMVIAAATTSQAINKLPVGFIGVSLGLNWALMGYLGFTLNRWKFLMYPLMWILNPILNLLYMVYGISTAGERTWGGPRADAEKADENTTPEQAVAEAKAKGDELNVALETFRPFNTAPGQMSPPSVPLMPSNRLQGRFTAAEQLPGGWYSQDNDSGVSHALTTPGSTAALLYHTSPRAESTETFSTDVSYSVSTPRRLESIIGTDEHIAYLDYEVDTVGARARARRQGSSDEPEPAVQANDPLLPSGDSIAEERSLASASTTSFQFFDPPSPQIGLSYNRPTLEDLSSFPQRLTSSRVYQQSDFLAVPEPAYRAGRPRPEGRQSSMARTGRSPLARRSYTRLATDSSVLEEAAEDIEMEVQGHMKTVKEGNPGRQS